MWGYRTISASDGVNQVASWLELDTHTYRGFMFQLHDLFQAAAFDPPTYIAIANKVNLVEVFGCKAICRPLEPEANIYGAFQSEAGATTLHTPDFSFLLLEVRDKWRIRQFRDLSDHSLAVTAPEHCMVLGV